MNEFIDHKVGGPDGLGACLQDATFALKKLHNAIVKELELEYECKIIDDDIDKYRKMPKIEISGSNPTLNKTQGEDSSDEPEPSSNKYHMK